MLQPDVNLQDLQENILRRLSAVDLTSSFVNKPAVNSALGRYLNALGLSPRPIRWAKDALDAQNLAAQSDTASVEEELRICKDRIFGDTAERTDHTWWNGRSTAKEAASDRLLEIAKDLGRGYDVYFSIPWVKYRQDMTGDRGRRVSPQCVAPWNAVEEVLEYAARAYADCAWILDGSKERIDKCHLDIWTDFLAAYEAGLWLFWITASDIVALPRPTLKLQMGILHSDIGPAISWPNGTQQYFFLNGVRVSRELVETPARDLDPSLILHERNVGIRREIVRKIGIERICQELETECLDRQGDYELILLDLQDGRTRPYLKMKNPSVGVYHIEGVAPECRTVAEALAWRNQSEIPPTVIT